MIVYIKKIILFGAIAAGFLLLTGCEELKHSGVTNKIVTVDSNKAITSFESTTISTSAEGSAANDLSETAEEFIDVSNHAGSLDELLDISEKYANKIDGAYAEAYSYNLLRFYKETGAENFIKALAARGWSCINLNSELLADEAFIQGGDDAISALEKDIEKIKSNTGLSSMELNTLTAILGALEHIQRENMPAYKAEKDDFTIKKGSKSISLYDRENAINLQDILGKPKSKKTEKPGSGSDTFSGSFIRELLYNGLKLQLLAPKGDEKAFWIYSIVVTGKGFTTVKGIEVGNSLSELKKLYPNITTANDGRQDENNCTYEACKGDECSYLTFEIKDGRVAEIKMVVEFP